MVAQVNKHVWKLGLWSSWLNGMASSHLAVDWAILLVSVRNEDVKASNIWNRKNCLCWTEFSESAFACLYMLTVDLCPSCTMAPFTFLVSMDTPGYILTSEDSDLEFTHKLKRVIYVLLGLGHLTQCICSVSIYLPADFFFFCLFFFFTAE